MLTYLEMMFDACGGFIPALMRGHLQYLKHKEVENLYFFCLILWLQGCISHAISLHSGPSCAHDDQVVCDSWNLANPTLHISFNTIIKIS